MTTKQKSDAWLCAAHMLRNVTQIRIASGNGDTYDRHILAVIVPSLERRARIIARRKQRTP